jgi:hypothetical protein
MKCLPIVDLIASHTTTRSAPQIPDDRALLSARPGIRRDRAEYLASRSRSPSFRGRDRIGNRVRWFITSRAVPATFWLDTAGNPHAMCDVAGAGIRFTVRLVRHSQRKRGAMDRPDLRNYGATPRPNQGPFVRSASPDQFPVHKSAVNASCLYGPRRHWHKVRKRRFL